MKSVLFFLVSSIALSQNLTIEQANHLASLPVKCLQQEYPNKLNQLLLNETELLSPKVLSFANFKAIFFLELNSKSTDP